MLDHEAYPISIPQLVREASFPIYGFVGNPLELTVCSVSWGSSNTRRTSVGFTYSSPRYPDERDNIEIDSTDAHQSDIVYNPKDALGSRSLILMLNSSSGIAWVTTYESRLEVHIR